MFLQPESVCGEETVIVTPHFVPLNVDYARMSSSNLFIILSIVEVFLDVSVQCRLECIGVGRIEQQVEAHALT